MAASNLKTESVARGEVPVILSGTSNFVLKQTVVIAYPIIREASFPNILHQSRSYKLKL